MWGMLGGHPVVCSGGGGCGSGGRPASRSRPDNTKRQDVPPSLITNRSDASPSLHTAPHRSRIRAFKTVYIGSVLTTALSAIPKPNQAREIYSHTCIGSFFPGQNRWDIMCSLCLACGEVDRLSGLAGIEGFCCSD